VQIRAPRLEWIERYPALLRENPTAQKEGIAGFELSLNYIGIPSTVTPRAASEMKSAARWHLLSVSDAERAAHPCRRLVIQRNGRWQLAPNGERLLELLSF
jgi:hypothetical protein